jgi:hypothetical protein
MLVVVVVVVVVEIWLHFVSVLALDEHEWPVSYCGFCNPRKEPIKSLCKD